MPITEDDIESYLRTALEKNFEMRRRDLETRKQSLEAQKKTRGVFRQFIRTVQRPRSHCSSNRSPVEKVRG